MVGWPGVVELDATLASDFEQTIDEDESTRKLLEQLDPQHAAAYRAALGLGDNSADTVEVKDAESGDAAPDVRERNERTSGVHSTIHIYEFRARRNAV